MHTNTPKRRRSPILKRRSLTLPVDLEIAVDRVLLRLKEKGQPVSFSGFVEASARELLTQPNYGEILNRHGASARRSMK